MSDDEDLGITTATSRRDWGESSGYTTSWSTDSFNLSAQSSKSGSPEHPTKPFAIEYPESSRPQQQSTWKPNATNDKGKARAPGPSYIGPYLTDLDDPSDEEAQFEKFKLETRIKMIAGFHQAAMEADVQLLFSIHQARKAGTSAKGDEAKKVARHERDMILLREQKETERKQLVTAERKKRREEIRQRSTAQRETPRESSNKSNPDWALMQLDLDLSTLLNMEPSAALQDFGTSTDASRWGSGTVRMRRPSVSNPSARLVQKIATLDTKAKTPSWAFTDQESSEDQDSSDELEAIPSELMEAFHEADALDLPGGWVPPAPSKLAATWNTKPPVNPQPNNSQPVPSTPVSGWTKKPSSTPASSSSGWARKTGAADSSANPNPSHENKKQSPLSEPPLVGSAPPAPPALPSTSQKAKLEPPTANRALPVVELPPAKSLASPQPAEKTAPPPPVTQPAAAGKKQNKKQRQQVNKKGGAVVPPPKPDSPPLPPTPIVEPPKVGASGSKQDSQPLFDLEEKEQSDDVLSTPTIAAFRKRSHTVTQATSVFGEWEEASSTPRPTMTWKQDPFATVKSAEPPRASALRRQVQINEPQPVSSSMSTLISTMDHPQPKAAPHEFWNPGAKSFWGAQESEAPTPAAPKPPQPLAPAPSHSFWVPAGGSTHNIANSNAHGDRQIWNPPSVSRSPPIEKSTSMPTHRGSVVNQRIRRMSDPASPSPRIFGVELPDITNLGVTQTNTAKKGKGKKNAKEKQVVTIEEVSDEEGSAGLKDWAEKLPSDSKVILEPKPSVPSTMFTNIFQYDEQEEQEEEVPAWFAAAAKQVQQGTAQWEKALAGGNLNAKHVRWTPSVVGGESPATQALKSEGFIPSLESIDDGPAMTVPGGFPPAKPNAPAPVWEVKQPIKPATEKKGKGKERVVESAGVDNLVRSGKGPTKGKPSRG